MNLSNRQVLGILLCIAFLTSAVSFVVNVIREPDFLGWLEGWFQNFSTEMFGAVATFILLELIIGGREEKQRVIVQMRSDDNVTARNAVAIAESKGWLYDGTLRGADLNGANLASAWLDGVDLSKAILAGANLNDAIVDHANLQEVKIYDANLINADLSFSNLLGADLRYSSLDGARILGTIFTEDTILPDGKKWTPNTDMTDLSIQEIIHNTLT